MRASVVRFGTTMLDLGRGDEFAPSTPKFMHRTETLDYGIVLSGECDLELDDGRTLRVEWD
jgi:hypothetical protein